jgi:hypothetical protein
MAYLHCHSCDWTQDDFWTKTYNPLTKIWSDIKWLAKPRMIEFDQWALIDYRRYFPLIIINQSIFSWNWFFVELAKEFHVLRNMKWFTWESWKKDKDIAVCPNCGKRDFDID